MVFLRQQLRAKLGEKRANAGIEQSEDLERLSLNSEAKTEDSNIMGGAKIGTSMVNLVNQVQTNMWQQLTRESESIWLV